MQENGTNEEENQYNKIPHFSQMHITMRFTGLLITIFLSHILLSGCGTKVLFEQAVPAKGKVVSQLPASLAGLYEEETEDGLVIHRVNQNDAGLIIVHTFMRVGSKDSLNQMLEDAYHEGVEIVSRNSNNITIVEKGDTVTLELLTYQDQIFISNFFEPEYVIDAVNARFSNGEKMQPAIIKKYKDHFFVNVQEGNNWLMVHWKLDGRNLTIHTSEIGSNESDFKKRIEEFSQITPLAFVENANNDKKPFFLINPDTKQLFKLLEEPGFFKERNWLKVKDGEAHNKTRRIIRMLAIAGFVIALFSLFVIRRRRKRTE